MEEKTPAFDFEATVTKYIGDMVTGFVDHLDPMNYGKAVKILDNPKSPETDRQKALAFAEAYKRLVANEVRTAPKAKK
jgi:hypothetical protein